MITLKKKNILISFAMAAAFLAVTAAYGLIAPRVWNSPDETAVAFFSKTFSGAGRLWAEDGLNFFNGDVLHPRSIISVDGALVPGSFYGQMFIVGSMLKIVGGAAFALATPLLTALAGICVYLFLRKRGAIIGFFGQIFFYLTPAVWYYASRGLFPNLLFCDLVIISAAVLYFHPFLKLARGRGNEKIERMIDSLAGGFVLGLAFLVRPVEFIWLAPLAVFAAVLTRKNYRLIEIFSVVFSLGFILAVFAITNNALYGSYFSVGYTAGSTAPGVSIPSLGAASRLPSWLAAPRPFILPFGFHPKLALTNLFDYLVLYFPWFTVTAAAGFFLVPRRYARRWALVFAWLFLTLGVYYGSGVFTDATIPGLTPGSSYVRYFLPLYLALVPLAAESVAYLTRLLKEKAPAKNALAAAAILIFFFLGAWTVYFRSPESLMPVFKTLSRYAEVKKDVLALTKPGNVIVTERDDKIFFPERRILLNLRDKSTMDILPKIVFGTETYYYGITLTDDDYAKIQAELFKSGLQLGRMRSFDRETFYSITMAR